MQSFHNENLIISDSSHSASVPPSQSSSMIASLVTNALKRKHEDDSDYDKP